MLMNKIKKITKARKEKKLKGTTMKNVNTKSKEETLKAKI